MRPMARAATPSGSLPDRVRASWKSASVPFPDPVHSAAMRSISRAPVR